MDLSAYIDDEDGEEADGGDAEDLAALKTCLKALADALASTNLAVLAGAHGDAAATTRRVQGSVEALKRFSEAMAVLDGPGEDVREQEEDEG